MSVSVADNSKKMRSASVTACSIYLIVVTAIAFIGYWGYALTAPRRTPTELQVYDARTQELSKNFWLLFVAMIVFFFVCRR